MDNQDLFCEKVLLPLLQWIAKEDFFCIFLVNSIRLFVPFNSLDYMKTQEFILLFGFFIGWSHKRIKFFAFLCRIKFIGRLAVPNAKKGDFDGKKRPFGLLFFGVSCFAVECRKWKW